MPKFPRGFGRRKSSANVVEDVEAPVLKDSVSSFKVYERPDGASKSFDGGVKLAKATGAHLYPTRPKTGYKEDNMFEGLVNGNRGSGASNTNTVSTTDNSSRLSAASTAASSTDTRNEEWKTPHDKPFGDIPIPPVPKSQSGFSLKAAGRSLSWGRNKNPTPPPPPISKNSTPSPTPQDDYSPRNRAVTASSYASTATPPKLDDSDLGLSLGGDFGDMFGGFGKRRSAMLEAESSRDMSHSPDLSPSGPASRPQPSNRFNQPTYLAIDRNKRIEPSQYSWSSQHSQDGLMSSTSPVPFAPRDEITPSPPPVPQHSTPSSSQTRKPGGLADPGLRRNSAYTGRRQSTLDPDMDEDAKLLRESIKASRKLNEPSYSSQVRDSWALPSDISYRVEDERQATWTRGLTENTPKAKKTQPFVKEDNMFDYNIETANLAQRFAERGNSPQSPHNKVMTPAQFERYRQDQERLKNVGGKSKDEEEEDEEEPYDDEEDEVEKNKQLARQRRKQEAHMAVYRQQMMKVTGETPSVSSPSSGNSLLPGMFGARSTSNLNSGVPDDGEEEDEEVPLAILQAHGFPNKNKPPMRTAGSNSNLRTQSMAGGALPVFARHLPEDPYYGAGLQHPMNRESMAFGGGTASVHGSAPRGLPPGGLVGVIATEERSRAMRRGSPNPQGNFGPPPPNGFDGMGMQSHPSMMHMGQMGGMNPMMMHPGDPAQMQMNQQMHQMQQFMQVQMQFMQMMSQGQGQQPMPSPQPDFQRPSSAGQGAPQLRPQSSHHRAMTMINPNSAPWMNRGSAYAPSMNGLGGYAPSIAPSERSNIGLPGRYRPVSHAPQVENRSRASTMSMSGALQGWENKNNQPTVKTVPKKSGNASDEDDDEGWEQMRKAKEKKKSLWRKNKDTSGLKDILGFAQ